MTDKGFKPGDKVRRIGHGFVDLTVGEVYVVHDYNPNLFGEYGGTVYLVGHTSTVSDSGYRGYSGDKFEKVEDAMETIEVTIDSEEQQPGDVFVQRLLYSGRIIVKRERPVITLPEDNGSVIVLRNNSPFISADGVLARTGIDGWVRTGNNGPTYYTNKQVIDLIRQAGGYREYTKGEEIIL